MKIEEEYGCEGFFGFGTGVDMAKNEAKRQQVFGPPASPQAGYCGQCPRADTCWFRHRGRVAFLVPDLTAAFEGIMEEAKSKGLSPKLAFEEWFKLVGEPKIPDPYTHVMLGNVADGAHVGAGLLPQERGVFTMPYPIKRDDKALGVERDTDGDEGAGR